MSSQFKYAFFDCKLTPIEEAKVSIMTNALQYGTAIFGGIRGYISHDQKYISVFRIKDHYERFFRSHNILNVKSKYSVEQMIDITVDLISKNKANSDIYLRPFGYTADLELSPNLFKFNKFDFFIYMIPLGDYLPTDKGLKVKVSSFRRIEDNAIPSRSKASGGYINSALARAEVAELGYDEAIFLTEKGNIAEGSAENIFIVRDGVIVTPSKADNILEGITRKTILEIAKDLKIPVEERSIGRSELYVADEAFFSGTGVQIAWIESVDNRKISNGKLGSITQKIQTKFFDIVRGKDENYSKWLTKIKIEK
jgi:branched-chain amino acid aminotransferase